MRLFLVLTNLLVVTFVCSGQSFFPDSVGRKVKYEAMIEMDRGYIGGICVMVNEGSAINGCLFNEFGLSVMNFCYSSDRVVLLSVAEFLDKRRIKRMLQNDMSQLFKSLQRGETVYINENRKISYTFRPLEE